MYMNVYSDIVNSDYYAERQVRYRSLAKAMAVTTVSVSWESNPVPSDLWSSALPSGKQINSTSIDSN